MATPDKFGVPILSGADNYVYWSIKLLAWMERDNATSGNTETPFIGLNVPQNKRAISNIKLMCGPGPIMFIKDLNSAQEAWEALKPTIIPLVLLASSSSAVTSSILDSKTLSLWKPI